MRLFFFLLSIQLVQLGIMCWNDTFPYIIDIVDEYEEPIEVLWYKSIANKFTYAAIFGLICYIILFFYRNKEYDKYLCKKATEKQIQEELEQLKRKDSIQYGKWEQSLQSIVENLDYDTYVFIKCKSGNVYRIGNNSWLGEPIHKESSEDTFFEHEESPNLEDIAHAIYRNEASIIAISKSIESL